MVARVRIRTESDGWRWGADLFDDGGLVDARKSRPMLESVREEISQAAAVQSVLERDFGHRGTLYLAL